MNLSKDHIDFLIVAVRYHHHRQTQEAKLEGRRNSESFERNVSETLSALETESQRLGEIAHQNKMRELNAQERPFTQGVR